VFAAAGVIHKISLGRVPVRGIASIDDELFALVQRNDNQVAVYSINDYKTLRHISLPGYKISFSDYMASCVLRKCLFMSQCLERHVLRYELASSSVSKWPVHGVPIGLSVMQNGNLLVTACDPTVVIELSAESGKRLREIALGAGIENLSHGIQLANGQFVVCHGAYCSLNRVCMVDDDGRVTRSYGGEVGSGDGQLRCADHLAVDEDSQLIFVADRCNNRVVVLSPKLEFVRYIIEGISEPARLYFDQTTRRLYVAHSKGCVTVIQF